MSGPVWFRLRRDAAYALLALLLVVAWDLSGADYALSRLFAGDAGFLWRDHVVASRVLHDGGRWFAGVVLVALAVDAWRPWLPGPARRARVLWLGVIVVLMLAVPALKRLSATSCPWDIAGLGGLHPYVPHWLAGVVDGGPGHCFPSGHAVAAFGFFGLYFLWRGHRPQLARGLLLAVLAIGALFGAAQLVRGAHYLSHTLWSAWLCWAGALVADALLSPGRTAPAAGQGGTKPGP